MAVVVGVLQLFNIHPSISAAFRDCSLHSQCHVLDIESVDVTPYMQARRVNIGHGSYRVRLYQIWGTDISETPKRVDMADP